MRGLPCLAGRKGIVTGASSGIGRATAVELVRAGGAVALAARRAELLETLAVELSASGPGRAVAVPTDVSDEDAIARMVETSRSRLGGLDFLVHSAGVGAFGPVTQLRAEDLDRVWGVNARAAILVAKHLAPVFAAQRHGALVFVGSVSSRRGWPHGTPYVASKFALRGAAECIRAELRPLGVRVVLVCPDLTETDFGATAGVSLSGGELLLAPEEVAATIRFALELPRGADLTELDLLPGLRG